jgi:DNA-binding LacI/PurR family transcriptional regulator
MHEATRRDLAIPRDLSIIGFDDFPAAQYSIPPLTSMRQPVDDMGVLAVKRLIENAGAQRGAAMPRDHAVAPHALVVRASTCPPPRTPGPRRAQPKSSRPKQ